MARFQHVATRLSIVGALALVIGSSLVAGVVTQALTSSAYADTTPYETFCPNTPAGNIVLNDVVVTGSLSPATPAVGQQFYVNGLQVQEQLPATIVQDAEATGLTSLTGTLTTTIEAIRRDARVDLDRTRGLRRTDPEPGPRRRGDPGRPLDAHERRPVHGHERGHHHEPGRRGEHHRHRWRQHRPDRTRLLVVPQRHPAVGLHEPDAARPPLRARDRNRRHGKPAARHPDTDRSLRAVLPAHPGGRPRPQRRHDHRHDFAPEPFGRRAIQRHRLPDPHPTSRRARGGRGRAGQQRFNGLAASAVDAYGATPDRASTGSMPFDVPIPTTVPSTGSRRGLPRLSHHRGPFTASGGPITIAQDESTLVVAALSSKAFKMSCTAYPNDSVATSGSTGTAPTAPPIRPVIATGSASGQPPTPTPAGLHRGRRRDPTSCTAPAAPWATSCSTTPPRRRRSRRPPWPRTRISSSMTSRPNSRSPRTSSNRPRTSA